MNNKRIAQSDLSKWLKELFDYFKDYNTFFKNFKKNLFILKTFSFYLFTNKKFQFIFNKWFDSILFLYSSFIFKKVILTHY